MSVCEHDEIESRYDDDEGIIIEEDDVFCPRCDQDGEHPLPKDHSGAFRCHCCGSAWRYTPSHMEEIR